MTIRNLDALFEPRSLVLIGASERAGAIGATVARNLLRGDLPGRYTSSTPSIAKLPAIPAIRITAPCHILLTWPSSPPRQPPSPPSSRIWQRMARAPLRC